MCDTMAVTGGASADGAVWLAKNSDREGHEVQRVEVWPARPAGDARQRCTWIEVPSAPTHAVILSRPVWMWGAEMGVNEHGVAIGNQAVFTRVPVAREGLTGMDLVRLALERSATAEAALTLITALLATPGQGGACSQTDARFRYHNAFLIADPREVWLLETAGPYWAAVRLRAPRSISNALTIGTAHDRLHPDAPAYARRRGWHPRRGDFDFARAFSRPLMGLLAGAAPRQACTAGHLVRDHGRADIDTSLRALRDHGRHGPRGTWRMTAPCSHSSRLPTRRAGQTTASMVVRLTPAGPRALLTGTPAPCLSVFKPVTFDHEGPLGGEGPEALFPAAERVHRARLKTLPEPWRPPCADALEAEALAAWRTEPSAAEVARLWAADGERWREF